MNLIEQQFIKFYEDNNDPLFRYCFFRVNDREIAIDLVQESFAKLWLYLSSGKEIVNMKSLSYKILTNLIIDYYRKKKTESLDNLFEQGFDVKDENTKIDLDKFDAKKAIELIQKLPEEYRDVLFMKYVNDLNVKEIADIVGERENTVAVRIHRGIEKLKKFI